MKRLKFLTKPLVKKIIITGCIVIVFIAGWNIILSKRPSLIQEIKRGTGWAWKGIVCGVGSEEKRKSDFCRKHCGPKDKIARWCDAKTYDENVPRDGMITYVAPGGCMITASYCAEPDNCPQDAWTCVAECPPALHRAITESGCGCEGNWSPQEDECVCRAPFILEDERCVPSPVRECHYNRGYAGNYVACIAPVSDVEIYWEGRLVHRCTGSCFTMLCVVNDTIVIGDYWFSRGAFREVIPAQRGNIRSLAVGMGGFYEVCRAPMK